jgi:N-methylhydantoinase A
MSPSGGARLAVDIGGTFTDVVVEYAGRTATAKVLTTLQGPEKGFLAGISAALETASLKPAEVEVIIHGTTLATNALIERKGVRTALLTTEGFRDVIELGNESRFDQYDINLVRRAPLVPRNWRLPIMERVAADGQILLPLDERSVLVAIDVLKAEAIESVAIAFLHSYVQPAHEHQVRALIQQHLPDVSVSLSSEVSPEMREYERFTTTCANAYIRPLVSGYLARVREQLKETGFSCPVYLMLSSGGLTTVETAREFPIRLVESGPAGGVIFAQHIAERNGETRVLSFDMGGTTAKISLIDDYKPQTSRVFEVDRASRFLKGSGMPVRIPVIDMVEIGAGGGSIAHVDRLGRIAVGPESAGASPGPACYARGGTEPTVTDADVVLGRIDVNEFAGGRVKLDPMLAATAMDRIGSSGPSRMDVVQSAHAIAELVDEAMTNAARVHAAENGKTLTERTLIAFGGAAPLHAGRMAEKLGISRVIVPPDAGVGSAVGFLLAPISYEVARSLHVRLKAFEADSVNAMLSTMANEARAVVLKGAQNRPLTEIRTAFARYVGQGHEIPVTLPLRPLTSDDSATLRKAFEEAYLRQYGRIIDDVEIEILTWTLTVGTQSASEALELACGGKRAQAFAERNVFDLGSATSIKTAIYRRSNLPPGSKFTGPAIVVEPATSTIVGPGYNAEVAGDGSIIITRASAHD